MEEFAYFGAGCFWHVQLDFSKLNGVLKTEVGYMGGDDERYSNPNYKQVCSNETGYAEVVKVIFNSKKISYFELLDKFFEIHNPTELNRQGSDVGTQYRSVIFFDNKEQKKEAESFLKKIKKKYKEKVVTQIVEAGKFFRAEEYHQNYLKKRGKENCYI